jgi:hypothetical protein
MQNVGAAATASLSPPLDFASVANAQIIKGTCPLIARREELGIFFLCC